VFAYDYDNQDLYYSTDFFQTWTACTGISLTGSNQVTAIRTANLWISDDAASGDGGVMPACVVLTNEGNMYYSFVDTSVGSPAATELASFSAMSDQLSDDSWYDMCVQYANPSMTSSGSQYIYCVSFSSVTDPVAVFHCRGSGAAVDKVTPFYSGSSDYSYYSVARNASGSARALFSGSISSGSEPFVTERYIDPDAYNMYTTDSQTGYVSSVATSVVGGLRYIVCDLMDGGSSTDAHSIVITLGQTSTVMSVDLFTPISETIRSVTHAVLDGYVVLGGTYEYVDDVWTYHPRRIRWTAPLTYNDLESSGSGSADLDGSGSILDFRPVNGRIVTFESTQIGSIAPRGYTTDPWEYDVIKENIRTISNPVVVDDVCYFIDDSGLLRATNGLSVDSPPFSFDLSEYDDFNADKPIWLTYSPEFEALAVYNPSDSNRYVYMIETESRQRYALPGRAG
jgi:hypothetical protein